MGSEMCIRDRIDWPSAPIIHVWIIVNMSLFIFRVLLKGVNCQLHYSPVSYEFHFLISHQLIGVYNFKD